VVAVRIEDVRAVVAGVVHGPLARRSVVPIADPESDSVELVHGHVVCRGKGEVHVLGWIRTGDERARAAHTAESGPVRLRLPGLDAEDRCDGLVEALRGSNVADAEPEVVDDAAVVPQDPVVHRLDAVPVRVDHEGAVVLGPVLRPRSGRPVVGVTRFRQRAPERVNVFAPGRGEPDVETSSRRIVGVRPRDREVVPFEAILAHEGRSTEPDRLEHEVVEALRLRELRRPNRHVVEHAQRVRPQLRSVPPSRATGALTVAAARNASPAGRSLSPTSPYTQPAEEVNGAVRVLAMILENGAIRTL